MKRKMSVAIIVLALAILANLFIIAYYRISSNPSLSLYDAIAPVCWLHGGVDCYKPWGEHEGKVYCNDGSIDYHMKFNDYISLCLEYFPVITEPGSPFQHLQ